MRYWFLLRRVAQVCLAICYLVAITPHASATQQTIPLNLSLDNVLSINATVTVLQSQITNGQLTLTATISGTAVVNGISATVSSQPLTVTATATCKAGSGTLILTTSTIQLSLSNGLTATVDPLMLTVTASCGKTPTLTVTASPGKVSLSDKTVLSTSQCSATLSSPSSTTIGSAVCQVQNLICQLAEILNSSATGDPIDVLNQFLTKLTMTLG
jgi:hypothetical protein